MELWQDLKHGDEMRFEYIRRIVQEQINTAQLLLEHRGTGVWLLDINTSTGVITIPMTEYINLIERNFDILTRDFRPAQMQPTKTWRGERRDIEFFSHKDVNRWFENILLIEDMFFDGALNVRVSGTYATGNNHARQMVRGV